MAALAESKSPSEPGLPTACRSRSYRVPSAQPVWATRRRATRARDPYYYEDSGTNPEFNSSNKNRKPFDSTSERKFSPTLFGLETPSIGQYPVFLPEKTLGEIDDNLRYPKVSERVGLRSGSLQRRTPSRSSQARTTTSPT